MADELWTLPEVIRHWAEQTPDTQAFIFLNRNGPHSTLTAQDIYCLAGRFATRLRQCGFTSGDVIANGLPNCPERVITDFGIVMAGCISLNCQIIEKDGGDFWNTSNVSECRGVIFPDRADNPTCQLLAPFVQENSLGVAGYRDMSINKAPLLRKAFVITRSRLDTLADEEDHAQVSTYWQDIPDITDKAKVVEQSFISSLTESTDEILVTDCCPDNDVYVFTTSGSTGPCKLVPRTHRELLRMARASYLSPATTAYFNDRQLSWLGGFPFDYFRCCGPRLLQDKLDGRQAQSVTEVWSLLERQRCDGAFLAPSDVLDLIREFETQPPDFKLKYITTAGVCLRQNAMAALGTITSRITNMYASTETGIIALLSVEDPTEFTECACGRAPNGVEVRVVGDDMEDMPPWQEGNVIVKSKNMFRHYFKWTPPEPLFTPDGWFMIRDRGVLDEHGILSVTCRQGDVVSQGVILIYLSWPEAVLTKCPDVSDVVVVGVKDSNGDDVICACVVPRKNSGLTEERLLDYYNKHFMSSLSNSILKPQLSLVLMYDTLPFNSLGKLDKRTLREQALRRLEVM